HENKKIKGGRSSYSPSRVLHIRRIPSDVTGAEVMSLGLPFGRVTNVLMLKRKGQAFLEMASIDAAISVMNYYTPATPHLRNQPVYIQYSNYKELRTDNLHNQARPQAALQGVNAVQHSSLAITSALGAEGGPLPSQGSVLRIVVENVFYPVTLEVLYQIFSKFGYVLKIVMFNKNNQFQALLQYSDAMNAYCAKMSLDGQSIYTGCCTLRVDFSKLTSLKIKYNNDKSRDFTRIDLPFGDGQQPLDTPLAAVFGKKALLLILSDATYTLAGVSGPAVPGALGSLSVSPSAACGQMTIPAVTGIPGNSVLLVSNLNPEAITPYGLFILFGVYGDVHRVKIMFKKRGIALVQMADATQAQLDLDIIIEFFALLQVDEGLFWFCLLGFFGFSFSIRPSVTVDDLKNLFASKGSTVRGFRFFQNDCKMALIQLGSVEEAVHALIELHNHDFGEKHHLRVSFSKSTI
ncbi:PTBP3 protein, partial [Smithornis capensis]|nr:PTBP3 protein [Smithornis capensis]